MELYQNRNWLRWKYEMERLSSPEIGKSCNASATTIRAWMEKFNIERRDASEKQLGHIVTEEARRNMRTSHLGNASHRKGTSMEEEYGNERAKKIREKNRDGHKGIYPSEKSRNKISESLKELHENGMIIPASLGKTGDKAFNWKGGITSRNMIIRSSEKYKKWREAVFKRDDYTCQNPECQIRGGCLHAHHIFPFSKYPELRFDINNGLTSCKDCHKEAYHR